MLLTSSWIPDLLLFLLTISFLSYIYATRNFNYWKKRDVPHQKPIPFFGNFKDVFTLKTTIGEWLKHAYDSEKGHYFGIFVFDQPAFVLKSPKLIKNILIKDFNNFVDRTGPLSNNNVEKNFLFFSKNPEWKKNRSQLSPTFTSGKLKLMYPVATEVGHDLQKYISNNLGELEAKEVVAKYTTDVIAKCFFGINAHCLDNENAIFRVLGRSIFDFRLGNAFRQTAYFTSPNLVKLFKINLIETWVTNYFTNIFIDAFKEREKSNLRKNDFIDILKDLKKKQNIQGEFNLDLIKGAGMQFFIAGFETTSSTISYSLHELCLNKSIQNRLRQEIVTTIKENNGELTYEALMGMNYLDMVIKETLRKYPVLPFLDRMCVNDYKLPGTDLVIEKGTPVYIPMFGLHYDEKYFPQPEKYDPERFSANYNSEGLVYIPFGEGPRICIGERFGLLTAKLGIVTILSKFDVNRCEKTPDPVQFEPKSLILQSKVGLPMTFSNLVPSPA